MFFSQIKQFLLDNKKIFYYIGFFIVIFFSGSDITFAAESSGKGVIKAIIWISSIAAVGTYFVSILLDPTWINGTIFGLDVYFKGIWVLISNVVYFVFAFLLIWIAFMNIIGKEGDKYQLKQALPKFVIGVIIVPFSWFFVQFVLSLSAILTVSALTLPYDTFISYQTSTSNFNIPTRCDVSLTAMSNDKKEGEASPKTEGEASTGTKSSIPKFECDKTKFIPLSKLMSGEEGDFGSTTFGLISGYTYGILGFDNLDDVFAGDLESVDNIADVVIQVIAKGLFVIIFSILIITLCLVLLTRGIYLWLYTMLSPIFGLMYFFDKNEGGGEGFFGKFNLKEFFALAMVPVYVMLALSFGLLFMFVIMHGITGKELSKGDIDNLGFGLSQEGNKQVISIAPKIDGAGKTTGGLFQLGIEGFDQNGKAQGLLDIAEGGLGLIGVLLMNLFGAVVFWIAIMAAMRTSDITKAITEPIHAFGNQVGGMIAKSPQYAPIFGGQSMQSIQNVGSQVQGHYTSKQTTKANKLLEGTRFGSTSKKIADAENIATEIKTKMTDKNFVVSKLQELIKLMGKTEYIASNPGAQKALFNGLQSLSPEWGKSQGFNSPSDLKDKEIVLKVIQELDLKSENYGNIIPGKSGGDISHDEVEKYAQTGKVNTETGTNVGGITRKKDGKNLNNSGHFEIDFNINGETISGTTGSTREIESFRYGDYQKIARYVSERITSEEQFNKMLDELEVPKDPTIRNNIKKDIAKYFKDGKVKMAQTDGKMKDLDDFLTPKHKI